MGGVEPIHAHSFFTLSLGGTFSQVLVFDYLDKGRYYYGLLEDERSYEEELSRLLASMNELLREEEVIVNEKRVEVEALTVNLDFRGAAELPTITFYIEFAGKLKPREVNVYECSYESGIADYDYEVYWFLPRGSRIVGARFSGEYEVLGDRMLVVWVRRGERYEGYERVEFTLP